MFSSVQIETVLKSKTIVDYLSSQGHEPVTCSGSKWKYLCPFLDHQETKPSFIVFRDRDVETFWCFGCSRGLTLINLIANLEGLTYGQTLQKLVPDYQITSEDEIKVLLSQIDKIHETPPEEDIGKTLINISRMCLTYLEKTKNDGAEEEIMDKFYAQLDQDIIELEIDNVSRYQLILPKILGTRKSIYRKKKLEERRAMIKEAK